MLGLTVNCARCHDHKFDPIPQKDYYALQASIFGYVETEVPLAPRAEAEAYLAKNDEIDARRDDARARRSPPSRSRTATGCELEQIKTRVPRAHLPGRGQAGSERTPGEKLLATQVFEAVNVPRGRDRQGC